MQYYTVIWVIQSIYLIPLLLFFYLKFWYYKFAYFCLVLARNLPESHQNPTPCMGYTLLSPSKMQHNQLLEFDGFGVVRG